MDWSWTTKAPLLAPPLSISDVSANLVQTRKADEEGGVPIKIHGGDATKPWLLVLGGSAALAVAATVLVILLRRSLRRRNTVRCAQVSSSEATDVPVQNVHLMGDDLPPDPLPAWPHHHGES